MSHAGSTLSTVDDFNDDDGTHSGAESGDEALTREMNLLGFDDELDPPVRIPVGERATLKDFQKVRLTI